MNLPEIAVFNFSDFPDADVQAALRAINRQVVEDFLPVWGMGSHCRLKNLAVVGAGEELANEPVTADAALYIVDEAHLAGAAGYHFANGAEVPYGFVFTEGGQWTVTFSHEVLELIADPMANCFVPGPDPRPGRSADVVLHAYEVCDAVERTSYTLDGVEVSNFVTPQYFAEGNAPGTRNDFLGTAVSSLGALPGCHLGFIDLGAGSYETWVRPMGAAVGMVGLPKARAERIQRALGMAARLPDSLAQAVDRAAANCKTDVAKFVRRSLRRNAYAEAASGVMKSLRRNR